MNREKEQRGALIWPHGLAVCVLLSLTVGMFFDVLLAGGSSVLGAQKTDVAQQFVSWRDFGFRELSHGNLALWNPHIYSGAPYFGGFQAALLYPPNWLFLVLPVAVAINWSIAMHVFLLGAFMYAWAARKGLPPAPAFLAGALAMFGGTYFPHIYAGHLPNLCTMVWAPLVFLAVDEVLARVKAGENSTAGWLLGAFAVAMQIFAGHPQYLFYTAVAAGLYAMLQLTTVKRAWVFLVPLAGIYVGGVALGAVQLFTGVQAANETIRSAPLPFEFAAMFSLPPENLLTLVAPGFFGSMQHYWGRCYLWEMSLFFGVGGFALAIYGMVRGQVRAKWVMIVVPLLLLLLAFGAHTPVFRLFFDHVPGFDKFRGISKFTFPALLFLTLLAGAGLDALMRRDRLERWMTGGVAVAGLLLFAGGIWVRMTEWRPVMQSVLDTGETYLPADALAGPAFVSRAQAGAATALWIAAGSCILYAGLFAARRWSTKFSYVMLGLAVAEVFFVARSIREQSDSANLVPQKFAQFLGEHPGDYRILNPLNPNSAMLIGAQDLWGADPSVVRRYAEWMAFTQGQDPDQATQYVEFTRIDPLYPMLRLKYALVPEEGGNFGLAELAAPLPRLQLVSRHRILHGRDVIFAAMREDSFDPGEEVILERRPDPSPDDAVNPSGKVTLVEATTDQLTIEADLSRPAILLITDLYTPAWRAVPLAGSVQSHYELQPANYILRAVPLAAGHHHLRVEYAPLAFAVGKWVTLVSLAGFVFLCGREVRRRRRM